MPTVEVNTLQTPTGPLVDADGRVTLDWLVWLVNANVTNTSSQNIKITPGTGVAPTTFSLLNSGVTPGLYGDAADSLQVTINATGQITNVSLIPIAIPATQVSGLGTMAFENSTNVAISGGVIANVTLQSYNESVTIASISGAYNVDFNAANISKLTLTGNATLSLINWPTTGLGGSRSLWLVQGGTGSYTVTWPASVHWIGGIAPTLATAVGSVNIITLASLEGGTPVAGLSVGSYI